MSILVFGLVSRSRLKKTQWEDWERICLLAVRKLADLCNGVISGDILVHELYTISRKELEMSKLCAAAEPAHQKYDKKKSSEVVDVPSYDRIKMPLDARLKELKYFEDYCAQLRLFLKEFATVTLEGI